ncbi:Ni/Fe-hydrogenase, b-type cytochrome subunit [Caenispirillum bisanense]|uniref:Probable Ni/Fe-hydrogenase B-type cytochrome subunit n=1 Tax=Caenispirillum bisanense TaxID=414052 RepID=A0A286H0I2_9PROT|nr:Ni/Fe-hydrogenase, b-type cytochrome subunit [Caenispirillum bisanense]SOE01300.1 Ni/Fe-hydrogenase 1 B-type cytochrome subunit [Caenispirillum bisanense]
MSAYTSKEALKEVEALGARQASIYVYEAPVRLWHWVNALAMTVLAVTGWFIASPLPSVPGEASANFLMGTIRFVHFAAGYVLAIGFLGRIYWAFVGNRHARQIFYVPVWDAQWWREIVFEAKWYAFLERDPKKYVGHNPLAHFAMFSVFVTTTVFMIVTGFALYAEGTGMDSWQYALFGWVIALFGDTYSIHTWHHVGMWVLVIFVMVHVYAAIREDIMSRQTMISTMVNGLRSYKDDQP